jgi:hypothetical protein
MNKHWAVGALMAMTGSMSDGAWAVREERTFEVFVSVPTRPFYIVPTEPDWIHQPQRLVWNVAEATMGGLRKHFDVRHDTSAIEARLDGAPYLSNGRPGEEIPLRVSFNNVELSPDIQPREVVSRADAAVGVRVWLDIQPVRPPDGYKPGDYDGSVMLLFNARAPGE